MATIKGLSHRFILKQGRFQLTEGTAKIKDNIYFLFLFDYVIRIYHPDMVPGLFPLVQKPGSVIIKFRSLILGKIKKLILKYVAETKVLDVDIKQYRGGANGKRFEITVAYQHVKENKEPEVLVQFV